MALEIPHSSDYPTDPGSHKIDNIHANLMASAYGDNSFIPSAKTDFSPDSGVQIAAAFSSGIWNSARDLKQTMSDAPSLEAEIIKVGTYSNLKGSFSRNLWDTANANVGKTDLGNRVPASASEHAGYKVPAEVQCSSTLSELMIAAKLMNPKDYKIRVTDMNNYLTRKFGAGERLSGNFDISDFPDGKVAVISATGKISNGSNHIALLERQGNNVFIVHNKNGRLVREDVRDKFYSRDGAPKYSNMRLFKLER